MKTLCEGCGKVRAAGGHRFCRACLGYILSQPAPPREQPVSSPWPPLRKGGDQVK
jgi:hypothetical protein